MTRRLAPWLVLPILLLLAVPWAQAHHVLGRPSYRLNEDSNTPPAIQGEVRIGEYLANYMVYPAFPKPGQPGRISFYATRADNGKPYDGKVEFWVGEDSWRASLGFGHGLEKLGTQAVDDKVFRQAFAFRQAGDYLVSIRFNVAGEPHIIDFPLTVGAPPGLDLTTVLLICLALLLAAAVSLVHRRRTMTGRIQQAWDEEKDRAE